MKFPNEFDVFLIKIDEFLNEFDSLRRNGFIWFLCGNNLGLFGAIRGLNNLLHDHGADPGYQNRYMLDSVWAFVHE